MIKIGFIRSSADPCLYVDPKRNIYITIWVDDLLIAGKNRRDIAAVKGQLAGEFEMKDLGELKHFVGMRIMRNPDGKISIDQSGYICQVLERYGMSNSKPVSTPLAPGARLAKAGDLGNDVDSKLCQGIVGSIVYGMLCTRPDWHSQYSNFHNSVQIRRTRVFKLEKKPCGTSKEPKQLAPSATERSRAQSRPISMQITAPAKIGNRYLATSFSLPALRLVGKQRKRQRLRSNQNMRR